MTPAQIQGLLTKLEPIVAEAAGMAADAGLGSPVDLTPVFHSVLGAAILIATGDPAGARAAILKASADYDAALADLRAAEAANPTSIRRKSER